MRIKFCGLRRIEDIEYANKLNPDYIGFVFAKGKRQISIVEALVLKSKLNPNILAVGVFLDNDFDYIKEVIDLGIIDVIQLHGNETDEFISKLNAYKDLPIIKAYRDSIYSDYILYDNPNPGSGEVFDWNTITKNKPFFLAGGISIDNIDMALKLNPYCIDVSSGIETNGFKDYKKMEELIRKVRGYE